MLGDLGSPEAIILELSYLGAANRRLALLVDAGRLRLSDAFKLALAAKVRLEFGEHTEHVEEALAGDRASTPPMTAALQGVTHARHEIRCCTDPQSSAAHSW